ncbi:hypothetical protein SGRI78S_06621 [Streptomyces griseus subsp. griseus]
MIKRCGDRAGCCHVVMDGEDLECGEHEGVVDPPDLAAYRLAVPGVQVVGKQVAQGAVVAAHPAVQQFAGMSVGGVAVEGLASGEMPAGVPLLVDAVDLGLSQGCAGEFFELASHAGECDWFFGLVFLLLQARGGPVSDGEQPVPGFGRDCEVVVVENAAVHDAVAVELVDGFFQCGRAPFGERLVGVLEAAMVADDAVPGLQFLGSACVQPTAHALELVDEAVHDAQQHLDSGVVAACEVVLPGPFHQGEPAAHGRQLPQRKDHERQTLGVVVELDELPFRPVHILSCVGDNGPHRFQGQPVVEDPVLSPEQVIEGVDRVAELSQLKPDRIGQLPIASPEEPHHLQLPFELQIGRKITSRFVGHAQIVRSGTDTASSVRFFLPIPLVRHRFTHTQHLSR